MNHLQALHLARLGYYVHPLVPRDKMPLAGGNGSNDGTRDEDIIKAWWKATPDANVGISLDKTGIVDVASDCSEWAKRFAANGMPATTTYTSGGGAGHLHSLYRLPKSGPVARINVSKQYDIMSQGNTVAPGSIHPNGQPYELLTELLPVEDLPLAPAWVIDMLQAHVSVDRNEHTPEDWQDLPSGALLAHSRRFQALCKVNDQLRAVVAGEAVTIAGDSSISVQRAVFVNQLLRAKYPHSEIRALAYHFSGVLESDPKWYTTDIDRLLFKYTPKDYKPESTGVVVQAPRGGRHYEITAGELLDRYHAAADCGVNGIVLDWSVAEAAEHLKVSTGTIKRREAELIADGHIKREYGRVILSPTSWEIRSQPFVMPQTEDEAPENTIGSQLDMPQQDAPNVSKIDVCEEHARVEITHLPVDPPTPGWRVACDPRGMWSLRGPNGQCQWFGRDENRARKAWVLATIQPGQTARFVDDVLVEPPHYPQPEDDEWAGIDEEIELWKRTTADGRRYAALEERWQRDAARVERLRSVMRGPPGKRVLSTAPSLGGGRHVVDIATGQPKWQTN